MRRDNAVWKWLQTCVTVVLLAGLWAGVRGLPAMAAGAGPPNIVFVLTDDLRQPGDARFMPKVWALEHARGLRSPITSSPTLFAAPPGLRSLPAGTLMTPGFSPTAAPTAATTPSRTTATNSRRWPPTSRLRATRRR